MAEIFSYHNRKLCNKVQYINEALSEVRRKHIKHASDIDFFTFRPAMSFNINNVTNVSAHALFEFAFYITLM